MGVNPKITTLKTFFDASPGGDTALRLLSDFPRPERRLLLAAKTMDGFRGIQLPGDVGAGIIHALDDAFRQSLTDPKTDRPWLVRAAACLFGSILYARIDASWEDPQGHPIFMAVQPRRPQPVLVSPLRLTLDAASHRGPVFRETWMGLFRFREGRGPLPHHIFRIDPSAMSGELRSTWQAAWSLVAVAGHFSGSGWDLDFSLASLHRLGEIVARAEERLSDRVRLGVVSVDRDAARREAWLTTAARAYLGETLRLHVDGQWVAPSTQKEVARLMKFPGAPINLDMDGWVGAARGSRQADLFPMLVRRLREFNAGEGKWPTPPPVR